jgi:hypothetical protein
MPNNSIFEINPLTDSRWASFVESCPQSSVFHTAEWLSALKQTYRYSPVVFTTSPAGAPLTNAIVFCRINSWLTGQKLISLPFSDHCEPLAYDRTELEALLSGIRQASSGKLKHVEVRPVSMVLPVNSGWMEHSQYHFHVLDLRPSLEELYSRLHKDSMQRKIRRAARERVVLNQGRSEELLKQFYDLLLSTRRRHHIPPQPIAWFRNLLSSLGHRLTIYVASVDARPIASLLTLRHKRTVVYKYGCSDASFHNLGAVPWLFWKVIEEAKSEQLEALDLGRSDEENEGLVRFKDHLGATRISIKYWSLSHKEPAGGGAINRILKSPLSQTLISHLPDSLFRLAGEVFYRHAG